MAKVKEEKSFKDRVLEGLNKTEAQKQEEKVIAFIEDASIECEAQIAQYKTSYIPAKKLEIKRLENELKKYEKEYETRRFSLASNLANYVDNRNDAMRSIDNVNSRINNRKAELTQLESELVEFENILADLKS